MIQFVLDILNIKIIVRNSLSTKSLVSPERFIVQDPELDGGAHGESFVQRILEAGQRRREFNFRNNRRGQGDDDIGCGIDSICRFYLRTGFLPGDPGYRRIEFDFAF